MGQSLGSGNDGLRCSGGSNMFWMVLPPIKHEPRWKLPAIDFSIRRFGGIYSLRNWMASHARKLFTSFAQAHVRASFAQARNHVDHWNINKWIYNEKGFWMVLGHGVNCCVYNFDPWRFSNILNFAKVRASFAQAKGFLATMPHRNR
jgi:hypothetical protein